MDVNIQEVEAWQKYKYYVTSHPIPALGKERSNMKLNLKMKSTLSLIFLCVLIFIYSSQMESADYKNDMFSDQPAFSVVFL